MAPVHGILDQGQRTIGHEICQNERPGANGVMPITEVAPEIDGFMRLITHLTADTLQGFHNIFGVRYFPFKCDGIFVGIGYCRQLLPGSH